MAKVLKVKRERLTELGDGFEVLTDAEVQESGIAVEADEVLVIATPPPVQPPSGDDDNGPDLGILRTRLHTVNQESAERRLKIKDLETRNKDLETQVTTLKQAAADRATEDTKKQAKELFTEYVKDKKYEFVSTEASEDVSGMVLGQIDLAKPFTKETIGPLVDGVIEKKKYFLKTPNIGKTDGGKQSSPGTEGVVDIDLEQIAREFNIPYKAEGAK